MTRDEALATLRAHEGLLRQRGVLHAAVFGSVPRGEQHEHSDLDIMVEIDPLQTLDIYAYVGLKRLIGGLFAQPVDVVEAAALKRGLSESARRDADYAF